jgi:hypothetical protein
MSTVYPGALDSYTTLVDNVDDVLAAHANDRGDAIEALEAKIGINSSALNTTIDYFLKHASGAYRTHIHDGSSDDGAKIPFADIAEVNISGIANQQYLRYNSATGKWENYTFTYTLDDLSDVLIAAPATREGIYYNGASWQNGYPYSVYAA